MGRDQDRESLPSQKYKSPPRLEGYWYSRAESHEAVDRGGILAVRIETSLACNLACQYCCNAIDGKNKGDPNGLTYEEVTGVVDQAKDLGARSVVVIGGGEPTIYPKFRPLTTHIAASGMVPVIFTNTQTMTRDLAQFLREHNTSVITKCDSLDAATQDRLTGVPGSFERIQRGTQNLIDVYDPKNNPVTKLGASFVVHRENVGEIPGIWKWCRERGIYPNLEMMQPKGKGVDEREWLLSRKEFGELRARLLEMDRTQFGFDWFPGTAHPGQGCFQVMHNLYVTNTGFVRPCACTSFDHEGANIRTKSLREILEDPFIARARRIEDHLEGKCGACTHHDACLGCRGLAYTTKVNLRGEDPMKALCGEDPSCGYEP